MEASVSGTDRSAPNRIDSIGTTEQASYRRGEQSSSSYSTDTHVAGGQAHSVSGSSSQSVVVVRVVPAAAPKPSTPDTSK